MRNLFNRFKESLRKTTAALFRPLSDSGLFGQRTLDAEALDELEEALYGADFGVETTEEILDAIQQAYRREKALRGEEAAAIGARVLQRVLEGSAGSFALARPLEVIALIGVNGSGKTTTCAKLGKRFKEAGHAPLIAACDTFRAAANEQLATWCERLDLPLIRSHQGADAAAVAYDAYQAAEKRGSRVLLLDTAGRLHNKTNLMRELEKMRRVLQKHDAEAPHHAWLVIDGSLGSNSIEQARVFHEHFGVTGLIATKLDGTSRGGALVGIWRELRLPIHYVGLGEQPDDLQPFDPEAYANAVFGVEQEVAPR